MHISNNGESSDQTLSEWTIMRYGASGGKWWPWYVQTSGSIFATDVSEAAMRPVFYLKSGLTITGKGTVVDPFVVQP